MHSTTLLTKNAQSFNAYISNIGGNSGNSGSSRVGRQRRQQRAKELEACLFVRSPEMALQWYTSRVRVPWWSRDEDGMTQCGTNSSSSSNSVMCSTGRLPASCLPSLPATKIPDHLSRLCERLRRLTVYAYRCRQLCSHFRTDRLRSACSALHSIDTCTGWRGRYARIPWGLTNEQTDRRDENCPQAPPSRVRHLQTAALQLHDVCVSLHFPPQHEALFTILLLLYRICARASANVLCRSHGKYSVHFILLKLAHTKNKRKFDMGIEKDSNPDCVL